MLLVITVLLACSISFATDSSNNINSTNRETNVSNEVTNNDTIMNFSSSDSISSNVKSSSSVSIKTTPLAAGEPTKLSQSVIFAASKNVTNYVARNGKLPNSVTISGVKFSMNEYMYLVSRAITLKYSKSTSPVTIIWNVKNPTKTSGSTIKKSIPKGTYINFAKKTYKFINKYKKAPNYLNSKYGKVQYQTAIFGFSKIGSYISSHKKLPSSLTLKVAKNSKLNKNKPIFSRSIISNSPNIPYYNLNASQNAIWVHSGDMKNVNLNLLSKFGIGNIFLHENAFKNYDYTISWIKQASDKGFKVHVWFTTFYNATSNKWTNPITNGKLNQNYFNQVISRANSYALINGVAGIHLDYLRYPGSAKNKASIFKYGNGKNGADAITEFVRQLSVSVKSINESIVLSAALMPEKSNAIIFYGQNAPNLGKYLDILVPMLYKGNYKQKTSWIKSTTQWYKSNSGGAEVWGGLYGYYSDKNLNRLSIAELTVDCKSVFNGGGNGIAIFRWGITNLFDLLSI